MIINSIYVYVNSVLFNLFFLWPTMETKRNIKSLTKGEGEGGMPMKINALLMDASDNVVTCVNEVMVGSLVVYRAGDKTQTLTAAENIPYCHKVAIADIAKGAKVLKYGEQIGKASEPITKGCWVSDRNIFSVPRDYESELVQE